MERWRSDNCGKWGWIALAAGVAVWDYCAGETLSSAFKRGMENTQSRPFVLGALAVTAAHLTDVLPDVIDPFHHLAKLRPSHE